MTLSTKNWGIVMTLIPKKWGIILTPALGNNYDPKSILVGNCTGPRHLFVFENLKHLETLWMPCCNITDISPLSKLKRLRRIHFDNNQISNITPLAKLDQLEILYLAENEITDLTPLQNLPNLRRVRLYSNQINDISPLVNNSGIGYGDCIEIWDNPLSEKSINEYIPALRERGVIVIWP